MKDVNTRSLSPFNAAFLLGSALLGTAPLWAAVTLALAHEAGHGPELTGKGPRGGRLAAVVPAADAELGARARVAGVAEWVRKGPELTVYLRDADGRAEAPLPAGAEVKWIVLGRAVPKPEVIRTVVGASPGEGARLAHSFEPSLLERADLVELILPSRPGSVAGKHVLVVKLK